MGSSIKVFTRASAKSASSRAWIASSFTASYNSFFASASASTSFASTLAADSAVSSVSTTYIMTGVDAGSSFTSLDLSDAKNELVGFASIASSGTGLTTEVRSYELHPDYISTLQNCGGVIKVL